MDSNNKRIAKNTLFLYLRMLLSIVVSLYTSRVVLQTLGVEDFGIYGVVGGVVAMFGFINASMAGATSRFMTYEMGRIPQDPENGKKRLADTFSSALIIHVGIAILIFVLAETVGLWFLCNKLVIPAGRMTAAHWVYQCSIIGAMLGITQAPYSATIIAHEKMDIYAYFELINVGLKLLIVYLLVIGNFDKLILYSILMLSVSTLMIIVNRVYCIIHFFESRFHWIWDKKILRGLASFSLYNLYGNFGSVVNTQGTNFAINIFFGVVYNAGASVATTVSGIVTGFASNVMTAFRPQITKSYAAQDYAQFQNLIQWALKSILLIYSLVAIPVAVLVQDLLALWLVETPPLADVFCRFILVSIFFETLRYILIIGIHANGRVKYVSLTTGTLFILNPVIVCLLYYGGLHPASAYASLIIVNFILCLVDLYLLKRQIPQVDIELIIKDIMRVLFTVLVVIALTIFFDKYINFTQSLVRIPVMTIISCGLVFVVSLLLCFNHGQREHLKTALRNKFKTR